jgi:DNA polymerase-1
LQADELRFIYELEIASSEALYRIERNGVLIDAPRWPRKATSWASASCSWKPRPTRSPASPSTWQPQAARRNLLRQAGHARGQEDRHRRAQHRRGGAGKAGRGLPLPAKLLEHRSLSKLKGTYTDKLAQLAPAHRPRAHHYAQAVAVTGPVQQRPQPAEHPHPHAEGRACARPSWRRPAA